MKQIINIQLGGRSIAIEDTAAAKVQQYLDSLRAHFAKEQGKDEIIADIESRFSELMFEKLRKGAPHITEADVDEMINMMGRPEDLEEGAATAANNQQQDNSYANSSYGSRKLFRDENNKKLGGVCSGIAHWLNIDPSIVRVLFAIIALGGFGTGIFIYILLWIFLPSRNLEGYKGKRLFRNPDEKQLGGVCSGIAAYFGKETRVIRLIFAAPLILSILNGILRHGDTWFFPNFMFGSLTGTFIATYIILWIVLPEAISPYEKMEMYGQPVDLNSIRNNVQNSMGDVKERVKDWSKEVADSASKLGQTGRTYGQNFGREFGTAAGRGARGLGYGIAMGIKIIFLIVFGAIIFSLFVALLALVFSGYAFAPFNNFLWTSDNQQFLAWGTLLLFIGAPIVGGVVWLVRTILNVTTPGKYLNYLFGGLWACGWVFLILAVSSVSKDFKRSQTVDTPVVISQPGKGKLLITVSQPELEYKGDFSWMRNRDNRINGFSLTKDTLKISDINLQFEKSDDSLYHVSVSKQGLGSTDEDALARINKIQYTVSSQDSILDLPSGYAIDKSAKYRLQHVTVVISVPVGKKIQIDESVYQKLNPMDIDFEADGNRIRRVRREQFRHDYESDVEYTMNTDGDLESNTGTVVNKSGGSKNDSTYKWSNDSKQSDTTRGDNNYRYNSTAKDTTAAPVNTYHYSDGKVKPGAVSKDQLNKEILQREKELEELKKKVGE
ncbi:MAG: PspC domain-containing protein [Niabella sp.]|nr:PspC domain-containing protein [Niabella sp.]